MSIKRIGVISNNPKKNDARFELENNGKYRWGGGLACIKEEGQLVIIYLSGDIQRYKYLCKVSKIYEGTEEFDLELIRIFPDEINEKFKREKLLELGLKGKGVIRYWLDSYPNLCQYVSKVLLENQIINEPFECKEIIKDDNIIELNDTQSKQLHFLNQIMYGPPGTGKTYKAINKALEIISEKEDIGDIKKLLKKDNLTKGERKKLQEKFELYKKNGQIEFITFHQSYGYEEFVEGIKPCDLEDCSSEKSDIKYHVADGIFKRLCEVSQQSNNFDEIYEQFLLDLRGKKFLSLETLNQKKKFKIFRNSSNSIVVKPDTEKATKMTITKTMIEKYILKNETNEWKSYVIPISEYIKENYKFSTSDNQNKNYILIIDEINRGNISKIFGELITLIEPSKRIGESEALCAKLSYSGEDFGVPNNLYIIGTMNMADRSIAPIDTALRRRFVFEEILPKPELLQNFDNVDLKALLTAINTRIEYIYDRDHTIGHSYFLDVDSLEKLREIFKNQIIPLLAEYFYEDWENIKLILNDNGFISEKKNADYLKNIKSKSDKKIYEITDYTNWEVCQFQKIYDDKACEKDANNIEKIDDEESKSK